MEPVDYLLLAILAGILGLAGWFIYRFRKSGKKCIGCPDSGSCSGACAGCSCGCGKAETK